MHFKEVAGEERQEVSEGGFLEPLTLLEWPTIDECWKGRKWVFLFSLALIQTPLQRYP